MSCFIALDVGTTHSRAWLVADDEVLAERRAAIGVRDTARDRSNARLHAALAEIIEDVERYGGAAGCPVIASGMIGSSLGLRDVPHLNAPASTDDLARRLQPVDAGAPLDRRIWIVPGVRTRGTQSAPLADVMRGEETLCVGALGCGLLAPGDTLVSIGSHWKRITVDGDGRVAWSRSSLGGELVEAVKSTTVIAEAVPQGWPSHLARPALAAGAGTCARVGLPRALFELRLDQLADVTAPDDRLAFLVGAIIGADLSDWPPSSHDERWAIVGAVPVADAWVAMLDERGHRVVRIATEDAERAQRNGLRLLALGAGILT